MIKMKKTGKSMPINVEYQTIVTDDGEVVKGHLSHFANCPNADTFRKEKHASADKG